MNFPSLESISWNLKLNLPWVSMTKWARVFLIPYRNLSDVPTLGGFRGEEGEGHDQTPVLLTAIPFSFTPDLILDKIYLKCKSDHVTPFLILSPPQNFQWPLITWDKAETPH